MKYSIKQLVCGHKVTVHNMEGGISSMCNGSWSKYGEVNYQQQQFNEYRASVCSDVVHGVAVCVWFVATVYMYSLTCMSVYDY